MTKKIYRQSNFYEGEGSRKANTEEGECQMGGAWQERGGGVNEGGVGWDPNEHYGKATI